MKRRRALFAVVAALAVVTLSSGPAAAQQPAEQVRDGCSINFTGNIYISVLNPPGKKDKKVIGIDRASMSSRARAILANFDANALNQRWSYRSCILSGSRYLQLRNKKSGMCLDKSRDKPNGNGNVIYQYPCSNAKDNQLWVQRSLSGSVGQWQNLVNRSGSRCLDIQDERWANGAYLVQWSCGPNFSQHWNAFP
jgi:hypothetical protein